jgi:hypothetical protein
MSRRHRSAGKDRQRAELRHPVGQAATRAAPGLGEDDEIPSEQANRIDRPRGGCRCCRSASTARGAQALALSPVLSALCHWGWTKLRRARAREGRMAALCCTAMLR